MRLRARPQQANSAAAEFERLDCLQGSQTSRIHQRTSTSEHYSMGRIPRSIPATVAIHGAAHLEGWRPQLSADARPTREATPITMRA